MVKTLGLRAGGPGFESRKGRILFSGLFFFRELLRLFGPWLTVNHSFVEDERLKREVQTQNSERKLGIHFPRRICSAQCQDWLARCQYTVTGWDIRVLIKLGVPAWQHV